MSLTSALAVGRAKAQGRMTDACTVRRQAGTAHDDDTGNTVPTWDDLYTGPCRMNQPSSGSNSVNSANAGEATVLLQQPELHLPMDAALLRPGDEVTLTASAHDPASVGRVFRIRAVPAHSQATARRYGVTERTS